MHHRTQIILRRALFVAVIVLTVAMAYVMHVPIRGPVEGIPILRIPHFDKIVHFSAYFLLSLTLCAWLWVGRIPVVKQILLVVVLLLAYSAVEEWTQQFSAGRKSDIYDWSADVLGFTLGCSIMWSLFRWGPRWMHVTEEKTA